MPEKIGTGILVKDVMIKNVITASPEDSVIDGARIMKENHVGFLVITKGKKIVGVLTREDIVNKVIAENKDILKTKLKDIMTTKVITASPEEDISEVSKRMAKYGYERLPVVMLNKLVGVISEREILTPKPTEEETSEATKQLVESLMKF